MIKRRNFLKGMAAASVTLARAGLPEILMASDKFQTRDAPIFERFAGKSNLCAKYAIMSAKYEFGKCFEWTNAWNLSEHNNSLMKIEKMNSKNNFNKFIDLFIDKKILAPGMIAGTRYGGSSWNGKLYDEGGDVWKKENGEFYRYTSKGINRNVVLDRSKVDELKSINYTHLMCYAGKDSEGEPTFWHQFPYHIKDENQKIRKVVLQKSIKLNELEKYGLSIKEILDESNGYSKGLKGCRNDVRVLGYGKRSELDNLRIHRNSDRIAQRDLPTN